MFVPKQFIYQLIRFGITIACMLLIWKGLKLSTNCETPIMTVLDDGMEPAFSKGSIILLKHNPEEKLNLGDIIIFKVDGRINYHVHRVTELHEDKFIARGDNHSERYRGTWVKYEDVYGKVYGSVPYIGTFVNDYPKLKYAVILSLVFLFFR